MDTVLTNQFNLWTYSFNFYDSTQKITGNIPGFTGTSGWIYSEYHWDWLCVKPPRSSFLDTVWLRFNFISDSLNTTKDGWMIDDIRFQADFCSDIPNIVLNKSISIYPNPHTGPFKITIDRRVDNGRISIFNLLGEKVYSDNFAGDELIINQMMTEGIYFVQVTGDNNIWSGRIIKE